MVTDAQRIVCVGINYRSRAEETGRDISPAPSVFLRFAEVMVGNACRVGKGARFAPCPRGREISTFAADRVGTLRFAHPTI